MVQFWICKALQVVKNIGKGIGILWIQRIISCAVLLMDWPLR